MRSSFFHAHAHSEFSCLDGMGGVSDMVAKAARLGQPALALTDHGVMSGALQLYKECDKAGLAAFPGEEFYVVEDASDKNAKRFHLGLLALDDIGYRALVELSSRSHERERFHRRPRIDFVDLAQLAASKQTKHLACTTGCFFGLVIQNMVDGPDLNGGLNMLKMLGQWFPNLYVELQHHKIDHGGITDVDLNIELSDMARTLSLPIIVTQDCHYLHDKHQSLHDTMKEVCYFGDSDDNKFPGGPYHLATTSWMRKQYDDPRYAHQKIWERAEEGFNDLLDRHKLRLSALDKYKFQVPIVSSQPDRSLKRLALQGLKNGRGHLEDDRYHKRISYELGVIEQMGMANYFLLVADYVQWCRRHGLVVNARGSANGSLVCYLAAITDVDPIVWSLSFDRFISVDRRKPPDIDLDVEDTGRDAVIGYVRTRFPSLVQLGTFGRLGLDEFGKGSILVQFLAKQRRIMHHADFQNAYGNVHTLHDLAEADPAKASELRALMDARIRRSPGAHAAGFVLPSAAMPIEAYLPTMLIPSSGSVVTQMMMDDVEEAGYMKIDLMGVRNLTTIKRCVQLIGRDPRDGLEWIPLDDPETCKSLRTKNTVGVFQFEGYSTTIGAAQMKIKSTKDCIICMALYRPAIPIDMKEKFLEGRKAPKKVQYLHPIFAHNLYETYGVPVFQDQVMNIMRDVGMSNADWNDLLKAVKASNDKIVEYARATFDRLRPIFLALATDRGMQPDTAKEAWRFVQDYSDYGFNRAHATAYGLMAYRSGYLKTHYPMEYMAAVLETTSGTPKEKVYLREARRLGIKIHPPCVNRSSRAWTVEGGKLRKGLTSIHGVSNNVATAILDARRGTKIGVKDKPFLDMEDFIEAVPARIVTGAKGWAKKGELNGVMAKLRDAHALQCLGVDTD